MKHVIVVAPDFAPSSLPPALRARFFVRHLPAFGWMPTVVSVDPRYYEHAVDAENERLVPERTRIVRTRAFPAWATRRFGVGDLGLRAFWQIWRGVSQVCRREKVDALLISVPPYAPAAIGRLAHARYGLPYVIDYIDPWVSDAWRSLPRGRRVPKRALADGLARVLEPLALRRVSHVVGVSKGTTDGVVRRYPWLAEDRATEIPYGAEPEDFEYARAHPRPNRIFDRTDGAVHVSSVGRGGWDVVAALRAVFGAFRSGLHRSPGLFGRLRLHFVGTSYAPSGAVGTVTPLAAEYGVAACVTEHPERVVYLDALQLLLDSDGLLAVGSEQPHYTASKIFPYLLARKPVLAVFHEASSVVGVMRSLEAEKVVTFGGDVSPSAREGEILEWLAALAGGSPPPVHPEREAALVARYGTRIMAQRLATVLDRVSARD